MNLRRKPFLVMVQAGMELSLLYPVIACGMLSVIGKILPFGAYLTIFVASAIITALSSGKGYRKYLVLILHIGPFVALMGLVLWVMSFCLNSSINHVWINSLLSGRATTIQWVELTLYAISSLCFWISGALLARRSMNYFSLCNRFDMGLAIFFLLFLLDLVIIYKGGLPLHGLNIYYVFVFLLFGLFALAYSKGLNFRGTSFAPGHGMAPIVAGLCAFVLLSVGTLALFFLPVLNRIALFGYTVASSGGRFSEPWIVGILRFLFGPRNILPDPPGPTSPKGSSLDYTSSPITALGRAIEAILGWGLTGLFILLCTFAVGCMLFFLLRWLLSRTATDKNSAYIASHNRSWLSWLRRVIYGLMQLISLYFKGPKNSRDIYLALIKWAKRSGISPHSWDTPIEFSKRLKAVYPQLTPEISSLTELYCREVYGTFSHDRQKFEAAKNMLGTLKKPRFWLKRFKTRIGVNHE
jgi:hypothetical protein